MVIVVACAFIFLAISVLMTLLIIGANYGKDRKTDDEEQLEAIRGMYKDRCMKRNYKLTDVKSRLEAKDRYEAELDKLEKLMRKRDELRSKELMEAFANSERSFEEVMRFLKSSEEETDA